MARKPVLARLLFGLLAFSSIQCAWSQEIDQIEQRSPDVSTFSPSSTHSMDPTPTLETIPLLISSSITPTPASSLASASPLSTSTSHVAPVAPSTPPSQLAADPTERNRTLAIIVGSVAGGLIFIGVSTWIWICLRRSKKLHKRKLFRRAATPLDDAEFESWRRPSATPSNIEALGSTKEPPPPLLPKAEPPAPLVVEKEFGTYGPEGSTSPRSSPSSGHSRSENHTDHTRNKSSVSVQDRPPTPYSPTQPPESFGSPQQTSPAHVHYPSTSETSDFDFGFKDLRGSI